MSEQNGVLYVVATPIGNLADITKRAIEVLESVDLIAAEDTRHSQKLLNHYGIHTSMMSLHEHNERQRVEAITMQLEQGKRIALVSDAGTPLISDPGYHLVKHLQEQGYQVIPVPGPSALVTALSASGLATDRFCFEGFLPEKATARESRLQELVTEPRTIIFYEAPHRLLKSLKAICGVFGDQREVVLARELTKTYETIQRRNCGELERWVNEHPVQQKGECVILVSGAEPTEKPGKAEVDVEALLTLLLEEQSVKTAAKNAAQLTGLGKNALYDLALEITKNKDK